MLEIKLSKLKKYLTSIYIRYTHTYIKNLKELVKCRI